MQDDDIETQIALVEKSQSRGYAGLIISPIKTLPMRTPIQRFLEHGRPIVIVGTELGIPPGPKLAYVLNDEESGGELAARRIGTILHGRGSIAILGISPQLTSNIVRQHSFEKALASEFPHVRVCSRRYGLASVPQEQQVAEEVLGKEQGLDGIVALSLNSTRGSYYALEKLGKEGTVKLVGFDQDLLPPIRTGGIDSVVTENTYEMGKMAMTMMIDELHGARTSPKGLVAPVLLTRDNIDSPTIQHILNLSWWDAK
jgi:ribose transport system substrate-binding protein